MAPTMIWPCLQLRLMLVAGILVVGAPSALGRTLPASVSGIKGSMVAYWGAGVDVKVEGSLASACLSGNYNIVIIAFLAVFGNSQPPQLILNECDASTNNCTYLANDISTCQSKGIKVFLSMGGASGSYALASTIDATQVATYVWDNYLGGSSNSRPLGPAILDGIDLDIEAGSPSHYGDLAQALRNLSQGWSKHLYLSSAPQCPFPDAFDGPGTNTALQTGLFDYVFVQFYNNYCKYSGDANSFLQVWNQWSSALPKAKIFLGLPAAPGAAGSGYLPSNQVISDLLPAIKANNSESYGGVMLWSVYWDKTQSPTYSQAISCAL